jgi:hypothetical protein
VLIGRVATAPGNLDGGEGGGGGGGGGGGADARGGPATTSGRNPFAPPPAPPPEYESLTALTRRRAPPPNARVPVPLGFPGIPPLSADVISEAMDAVGACLGTPRAASSGASLDGLEDVTPPPDPGQPPDAQVRPTQRMPSPVHCTCFGTARLACPHTPLTPLTPPLPPATSRRRCLPRSCARRACGW